MKKKVEALDVRDEASKRSTAGARGSSMARSWCYLALPLATSALVCAGCAIEVVDDSEGDDASMTARALTGDALWHEGQQCSEEAMNRSLAAYQRGRIGARSAAFAECLSVAATEPLARMSGSLFGPYKRCGGSLPDFVPEMSQPAYAGYLLSVTASRMQVRFRCLDTQLIGDSVPYAAKNASEVGAGIESLRWLTIGTNPSKNGGLIWHEVAHSHVNGSHVSAANCGYSSEEYVPGANGGVNIIGKCMQEVLQQSDASPECALLECPAEYQPIIRRYGQYELGDPCECVPDVFRWPANENEANDRYGSALATGDFNDDGHDDLAVGAPGEGGAQGSLYVFKGSPHGLRFWQRTSQYFITTVNYTSNPPVLATGSQSAGDEFGHALASSDFNGDGYDDLAVGTPGKYGDAGVVYIFSGSELGLNSDEVQLLTQAETGGAVEAGDRFGTSLVAGEFVGALSHHDLAVGAPFEVLSGAQSGVVSVYRGRASSFGVSGLLENGGGILHQGMGPWSNENGDEFGAALAISRNPYPSMDLLVGAPGENDNNGYVFAFGVSGSNWTATTSLTATSTRFGSSIASAQLIGDFASDIFVGAPAHNNGRGAIFAWRSTGTLSNPLLTLAQGIQGDETDELGASLAVVQGDSARFLAVGAPGEAFGSGPAEGRIMLYTSDQPPSSSNGLLVLVGSRSQANFFDTGDYNHILPPEERGVDGFGRALVSGYFGETEAQQFGQGIAVGAPYDTIEGHDAGAVFVYSNRDQFAGGRKLDQVTMRHGDAWPIY